ncbi:MAG TPA: DUF4432 domain-containing protein [Planctomycetaceae bacterium]|jgi:hypothetical protein|nr:aldose 1-epimerase family protein [Pirellulales bacterium]HCK72957.1 DUF4432 domain-containing protein [Planctomycetaceae bacterium]HCP83450.1 DUF4432 domain-containing protein [Planctomycetaceae bacterium]|tara:strand:- start:983 stop:2152 length:1170 start_codon:yes stop_codon:yes gene_type:complete
MAAKSWNVVDASSSSSVEESTIVSAKDIQGAPESMAVTKRVYSGGLSGGVEIIRVNNGRLVFDILVNRGLSLWNAWIGDFKYGWQSPVKGPVNPEHVHVGESSGLGWLDGFDELMVRCGLESNGAPEFDDDGRVLYPLHGRIANKPASKVDVSVDEDAGTITVSGEVLETRFHFAKLKLTASVTTSFGSNSLRIDDTVKNLSASASATQMLYHVNFGVPLLDAGSQVIAPCKTIVPRNDHAASGIDNWNSYGAPEAGFEEQVYFTDLHGDKDGETTVLLKNAHGTRGASLHYNVHQLPCFSMWKNTTAVEDGYVTGIEPGTNYPNPRTYEGEHGRETPLDPLGSTTFSLGIGFLENEAEVTQQESAVAKLLEGKDTHVYRKPRKGWCAP